MTLRGSSAGGPPNPEQPDQSHTMAETSSARQVMIGTIVRPQDSSERAGA